MKGFKSFLGILFVLALAPATWGAVPQLINFQGLLTSPGGAPVADGSYSVTFNMYDAATGGTPLWSETQSVTTTGGVFSALLGSTSPIPDSAFNDSSRYLGITVAPDAEMSPRQKLVSVAFANRVGSIFGASGGLSVEFGDSSDTLLNLAPEDETGIEMACVPPPAVVGPCPPWVLATVGNPFAPFGQRAGSLRILGCNGAWTIRGNGWNGDFTAMGKATFGPGHVNSGIYSFIAGARNTITGGSDQATIPGGFCNLASADYATVGGGTNNSATALQATIGGGQGNVASNQDATIGGGNSNGAAGTFSTIGGGFQNKASGLAATVAGGEMGTAQADYTTVAGGQRNNAIFPWSAIGGGQDNLGVAAWATVAGGQRNTSAGQFSATGGGQGNIASGQSSVIGGGDLNQASGDHSTVPGGEMNIASGNHSFAAGSSARAVDSCSFVWSDCCNISGTTLSTPFYSNGVNSFNVRAQGGVYLITNCDSMLSPTSTGVILPAGGSAWSSLSDSTMKHNIRPVNGAEILARLAELPVNRWSYKAQDAGVEHIGPMAQDFYRLFRVGEDNRHISTLDPDGIALAAIKELDARNQEQQAEIDALKAQLAEQTSTVKSLNARLADLQEAVETILAANAGAGDVKLTSAGVTRTVSGR